MSGVRSGTKVSAEEKQRRIDERNIMVIKLAHSLNPMWVAIIRGQLADTAWAKLWDWQRAQLQPDE